MVGAWNWLEEHALYWLHCFRYIITNPEVCDEKLVMDLYSKLVSLCDRLAINLFLLPASPCSLLASYPPTQALLVVVVACLVSVCCNCICCCCCLRFRSRKGSMGVLEEHSGYHVSRDSSSEQEFRGNRKRTNTDIRIEERKTQEKEERGWV